VYEGGLYFSQQFISHWGKERTLPICYHCNKYTEKKHTPMGSMLFRQVNDGNGELVFFSASDAQYGFALKTGRGQFSVRLQNEGEHLQLLINHQKIHLTVNEITELTLADQNYYILLEQFKLSEYKVEGSDTPNSHYKATIIIWLNKT
jgi:hypothetical protein